MCMYLCVYLCIISAYSYGHQTLNDVTESESFSAAHLLHGSTSDSLVTQEGISITIKMGSLVDQQVNVPACG